MIPLYDAPTLQKRVQALGRELLERLPQDEPILALVVLRGAIFFAADLLRELEGRDLRVGTLRLASYEGTESRGDVRLIDPITDHVAGHHVVVIEDIIDTGHTIAFLREHLAEQRPASVTVVTLLDKPSRRKVEAEADLVGFTIDDHFVVGYGLDLDQRFRHLPYVAMIEPSDLDVAP